jgi:hypothetical protein
VSLDATARRQATDGDGDWHRGPRRGVATRGRISASDLKSSFRVEERPPAKLDDLEPVECHNSETDHRRLYMNVVEDSADEVGV